MAHQLPTKTSVSLADAKTDTPPAARASGKECTLKLLLKDGLHYFSRLLLACALLVCIVPTALSQASSGVLGGKVYDPLGNVIPHATVTVTSVERGTVWTVQTNREGSWRLNDLIVGHYTFQVAAQGFKTLEHAAIDLQISDQKFIDETMTVGATEEKITVVATTPLIDTTAGISGAVITTEQLEELPSQTNSPVQLAALVPGVILGIPTGGVPHLWANTSESAFTMDSTGQGTNSVNYQLDGGTDTRAQTGIAYIPPMDAIGEVRVMTNAYDASIGRTAGGTIDMTMKAGGKDLHGTLYEMNQNNMLNARAYTSTKATPVDPVHYNEYGGTAGGPIWLPRLFNGRKNETFFFFNWDGIRNSSPHSTGMMSLPTMAERSGDFSQSFTSQTVNNVLTTYPIKLYDPLTYNATTKTRSLMSGTGTSVPQGRISPIAKAYLSLLPQPNRTNDATGSSANNYVINDPKIDKLADWSLRVDKAWTMNHHSFAEFRWNSWSEIGSDPFGPVNILAGQLQTRMNWGATVAHSWVMTPTFLLDLHLNMTAMNNTQTSTSATTDPTKFGFASGYTSLQQFKGLPKVTGVVSGGPAGGLGSWQSPNYQDDRLYNANIKVTQIRGDHTLRYGFEYLYQAQATGSETDGEGNFGFGNNWTTANPDATAPAGQGSSFASFLMGMPTSGQIINNATAYYTQPFIAFYTQDDWRATKKLTLNFGLRWDYQMPMYERHNKYWSRYDAWAEVTPVSTSAQPLYAALIANPGSNIGSQALAKWRPDVTQFKAYGEVQYAGVNGVSRAVNDPYWKYFQPRLGFAYQLRPNTVIRGGVGRFVEANFTSNDTHQDGYSATTPFQSSLDNYHTVNATLDNPFPTGLVAVTGNAQGKYTNIGGISSFIDPNGVRQFNDEASLHLQQQARNWLFELGATLNLTRGITVGYNIDGPSNLDAWHAMYGPQFDNNGRPLDTLSAATNVPNPFKGAPYITNGLQNQTTIQAWQLMRPNPLLGGLTQTEYKGRTQYYALQSRAEHRFQNGFGLLTSFTWGKQMDETSYQTSYLVSMKLKRMLSTGDRRFLITVTPTYMLPFGHGKWLGKNVPAPVNQAISGWELSGIWTYNSGSPIQLPVNSSFWDGTSPSLGKRKGTTQWFDTSKFWMWPSRNTTVQQLAQYPSWTGVASLPGYGWTPTSSSDATKNGVYNDFKTWSTNNSPTFGNVRNPAADNFDLGLRKSFDLHETTKLQLRIDTFNALNHPRYTGPDTTPGDLYFGYISGNPQKNTSNFARAFQIAGKIVF